MKITINWKCQSKIYLSQIHLAATMKKDDQIIVSDHLRLSEIFHCEKLNKYDCFGLKKHGNFTAQRIKRSRYTTAIGDYFDDVTYVQVKNRFSFILTRNFTRTIDIFSPLICLTHARIIINNE